jgi:hypothetical protein
MDASASVGSRVRWRYKIYATDTLEWECRIKRNGDSHFSFCRMGASRRAPTLLTEPLPPELLFFEHLNLPKGNSWNSLLITITGYRPTPV